MSGRKFFVLLPLTFEEVEVVDELLEEAGGVLFVVAECTEKHEQAEATLTGNTGAGGDVLAWLLLDVELDPFTAVWVNGSGYQLMLGEVTKSVSLTRLEDHTRRSNQLANYNTLGAVDHERAAIGHHREITHEDLSLIHI